MAKQQKTYTRECKVVALQLVKSSDCIPLSDRSVLSPMSNRWESLYVLALHQSGSRSTIPTQIMARSCPKVQLTETFLPTILLNVCEHSHTYTGWEAYGGRDTTQDPGYGWKADPL